MHGCRAEAGLAVLEAVVIAVVLFVAAAAATGRLGGMAPAERDLHDPGMPIDRAVRPDDLDRVRFGVVLRGYRMSEVDEVIDRLRDELADRDAEIAELRGEARPLDNLD